MNHQKSHILLIFGTLIVGGCGGHGCYFKPNPRLISQMSLANEYTDIFFMDESSILDAHLRLLFRTFHYETPCISIEIFYKDLYKSNNGSNVDLQKSFQYRFLFLLFL